MNDIMKYNADIAKFIIIIIVTVAIVILFYKIWEKYFNLSIDFTMGFKSREPFNQISLQKQVEFQNRYRNYIDGINNCGLNRRMIPFIVPQRCFNEKYIQCMNGKKHNLNTNTSTFHTATYDDGFRIASRDCQDQSYKNCLTNNLNFA